MGALSASAAAEIRRLKPASVTSLGGASAISSAVAQQVEEVGPPVVRWQGRDRNATAAAISQATYPGGAANVYLATGGAFPDALAGAALAARAGGPLLLTDPVTLPDSTKTEIARLHPSAIVIFGGTSAVSAQVASAAGAAKLYDAGDLADHPRPPATRRLHSRRHERGVGSNCDRNHGGQSASGAAHLSTAQELRSSCSTLWTWCASYLASFHELRSDDNPAALDDISAFT